MIRQEAKTPGYCLRRGTLYGAALGLLGGLASVAFKETLGSEAITTWRNWILAGAALGFVAGAIRAVRIRNEINRDI